MSAAKKLKEAEERQQWEAYQRFVAWQAEAAKPAEKAEKAKPAEKAKRNVGDGIGWEGCLDGEYVVVTKTLHGKPIVGHGGRCVRVHRANAEGLANAILEAIGK